jgi:hypothetical protein
MPVKGPTRDCPDHFVGCERLRCDTCGWDAAINAYPHHYDPAVRTEEERLEARRVQAAIAFEMEPEP